MASNYRFVILAIVAIILPTVAMATEYIVGDDAGWTVGFDYQAWAKDKVFLVGDKLVFQYTPPDHNVIKVNGTEFKECQASKLSKPLTTGNDTITLSTPGRKWYICGKPGHCAQLGQKLVITVVADAPAPAPTLTPTPTPTPTPDKSSAFGIMSSGSRVIAAAAVALMVIIRV